MLMKPEKIQPVAKECAIMHEGKLMTYDEEYRTMHYSPNRFSTFQSKAKAKQAMHRAIAKLKEEGRVEEWKTYYQVIET